MTNSVRDFHVSSTEKEVAIITNYEVTGGIVYLLDPSSLISTTKTYNQVIPSLKVAISGTRIYVLKQNVSSSLTLIQKIDHLGVLFDTISLPFSYNNMALSNSNLRLIVWNSVT